MRVADFNVFASADYGPRDVKLRQLVVGHMRIPEYLSTFLIFTSFLELCNVLRLLHSTIVVH